MHACWDGHTATHTHTHSYNLSRTVILKPARSVGKWDEVKTAAGGWGGDYRGTLCNIVKK